MNKVQRTIYNLWLTGNEN